MLRKIKICALVCAFIALFCLVVGGIEYRSLPNHKRFIDHIANSDADSSLGLTEIPEDGIVGNDFTSHLPLVVIDTGGEIIQSFKVYDPVSLAHEVPDGIDPYYSMQLSVYDSGGHINSLSDAPTLVSHGRIRVRGNSSSDASLPKHPYKIELENENGESQAADIMGLGSDDDWALVPTIWDKSHIRNYLAYNVAGQAEPFTPDLRFCEVLFLRDGSYYYGGLYKMCETVKVSESRVNIKNDLSRYHVGLGYLLQRDRYSDNKVMLNTWGTEKGYNTKVILSKLQGSYFSLKYPKNKNLTDDIIKTVEDELSLIERLLYDNGVNHWDELEELIDMKSFADYFVINEFFTNYDAGMNSIYMYKAPGGKLTAGPFWDFDGSMDNYNRDLHAYNDILFQFYPWYSELIKYEKFERLVEQEYRTLRKSVLSDEYLSTFIDDTQAYLGNALLRDDSAFGYYSYITSLLEDKSTGLTLDRRRETSSEEIQRVKDYLLIRGSSMDKNIETLRPYIAHSADISAKNNLLATLMILGFIVSTVLVRRWRSL